MKLSKVDFASIMLMILLFIGAFYIYPIIPEKMPIHWNAKGDINGYGNRFAGLFLLPIILAAIYLLLFFIPLMDPYRKNILTFSKYLDLFKIVFVIFFVFIYVITLLPNFGINFNINLFMIPAIAVLFYFIGHILQFVKRNYFIGIRLPWTLDNEEVWNKTHRMASLTFRLNAAIILLAMVMPNFFVWILLTSILINILFLCIYSFKLWKKLNKSGGREI